MSLECCTRRGVHSNGLSDDLFNKSFFVMDDMTNDQENILEKRFKYVLMVVAFLILALILVSIYLFHIIGLGNSTTLRNASIDDLQQNISEEYVRQDDIEYSTEEVIEMNQNYIAQVLCTVDDGVYAGSGVVVGKNSNGNLLILTNHHVIESFHLYSSGIPSCLISYQNQQKGEPEVYYVEPVFSDDDLKESMEMIDFALLQVRNDLVIESTSIDEDGVEIKDEQERALLDLNEFPVFCSSEQLNIGEDLIILGFPDISGIGFPVLGSTAKFTVTEGIISENVRYSSSYYFNTSAKIDQGNSGGGAFLNKSGCLAGVPTFVRVGEAESLGRILNADKLKREFISHLIK